MIIKVWSGGDSNSRPLPCEGMFSWTEGSWRLTRCILSTLLETRLHQCAPLSPPQGAGPNPAFLCVTFHYPATNRARNARRGSKGKLACAKPAIPGDSAAEVSSASSADELTASLRPRSGSHCTAPLPDGSPTNPTGFCKCAGGCPHFLRWVRHWDPANRPTTQSNPPALRSPPGSCPASARVR